MLKKEQINPEVNELSEHPLINTGFMSIDYVQDYAITKFQHKYGTVGAKALDLTISQPLYAISFALQFNDEVNAGNPQAGRDAFIKTVSNEMIDLVFMKTGPVGFTLRACEILAPYAAQNKQTQEELIDFYKEISEEASKNTRWIQVIATAQEINDLREAQAFSTIMESVGGFVSTLKAKVPQFLIDVLNGPFDSQQCLTTPLPITSATPIDSSQPSPSLSTHPITALDVLNPDTKHSRQLPHHPSLPLFGSTNFLSSTSSEEFLKPTYDLSNAQSLSLSKTSVFTTELSHFPFRPYQAPLLETYITAPYQFPLQMKPSDTSFSSTEISGPVPSQAQSNPFKLPEFLDSAPQNNDLTVKPVTSDSNKPAPVEPDTSKAAVAAPYVYHPPASTTELSKGIGDLKPIVSFSPRGIYVGAQSLNNALGFNVDIGLHIPVQSLVDAIEDLGNRMVGGYCIDEGSVSFYGETYKWRIDAKSNINPFGRKKDKLTVTHQIETGKYHKDGRPKLTSDKSQDMKASKHFKHSSKSAYKKAYQEVFSKLIEAVFKNHAMIFQTECNAAIAAKQFDAAKELHQQFFKKYAAIPGLEPMKAECLQGIHQSESLYKIDLSVQTNHFFEANAECSRLSDQALQQQERAHIAISAYLAKNYEAVFDTCHFMADSEQKIKLITSAIDFSSESTLIKVLATGAYTDYHPRIHLRLENFTLEKIQTALNDNDFTKANQLCDALGDKQQNTRIYIGQLAYKSGNNLAALQSYVLLDSGLTKNQLIEETLQTSSAADLTTLNTHPAYEEYLPLIQKQLDYLCYQDIRRTLEANDYQGAEIASNKIINHELRQQLDALIEAHHTANLFKKAEAQYNTATTIEDFEKASEGLRAVLVRDPKHHTATATLAWCYLQQKKYQEALDCVENNLKLQPDSASDLAIKGIAQFFSGQADTAKETLARALSGSPLLPKGYFLVYADCMIETRSLKEGLENLGQVYQSSPDNSELSHALAKLHFMAGDLSKAEEWITTSLKTNEHNADALCLKANIAYLNNELLAAQSQYNVLKLSFPEHLGVQQLGAFIAYSFQDYTTVIESMTKLIANHQSLPQCYSILAQSYIKTNAITDGLSVFHTLRQQEPENVQLLLDEADLHVAKGDFNQALELANAHLKAAISVKGLCYRAQIWLHLHDLEAAESDYHQAVSLDSQSQESKHLAYHIGHARYRQYCLFSDVAKHALGKFAEYFEQQAFSPEIKQFVRILDHMSHLTFDLASNHFQVKSLHFKELMTLCGTDLGSQLSHSLQDNPVIHLSPTLVLSLFHRVLAIINEHKDHPQVLDALQKGTGHALTAANFYSSTQTLYDNLKHYSALKTVAFTDKLQLFGNTLQAATSLIHFGLVLVEINCQLAQPYLGELGHRLRLTVNLLKTHPGMENANKQSALLGFMRSYPDMVNLMIENSWLKQVMSPVVTHLTRSIPGMFNTALFLSLSRMVPFVMPAVQSIVSANIFRQLYRFSADAYYIFRAAPDLMSIDNMVSQNDKANKVHSIQEVLKKHPNLPAKERTKLQKQEADLLFLLRCEENELALAKEQLQRKVDLGLNHPEEQQMHKRASHYLELLIDQSRLNELLKGSKLSEALALFKKMEETNPLLTGTVRPLSMTPSDKQKEAVIHGDEVLLIKSSQTFSIGFRGIQGQYLEKPLDRKMDETLLSTINKLPFDGECYKADDLMLEHITKTIIKNEGSTPLFSVDHKRNFDQLYWRIQFYAHCDKKNLPEANRYLQKMRQSMGEEGSTQPSFKELEFLYAELSDNEALDQLLKEKNYVQAAIPLANLLNNPLIKDEQLRYYEHLDVYLRLKNPSQDPLAIFNALRIKLTQRTAIQSSYDLTEIGLLNEAYHLVAQKMIEKFLAEADPFTKMVATTLNVFEAPQLDAQGKQLKPGIIIDATLLAQLFNDPEMQEFHKVHHAFYASLEKLSDANPENQELLLAKINSFIQQQHFSEAKAEIVEHASAHPCSVVLVDNGKAKETMQAVSAGDVITLMQIKPGEYRLGFRKKDSGYVEETIQLSSEWTKKLSSKTCTSEALEQNDELAVHIRQQVTALGGIDQGFNQALFRRHLDIRRHEIRNSLIKVDFFMRMAMQISRQFDMDLGYHFANLGQDLYVAACQHLISEAHRFEASAVIDKSVFQREFGVKEFLTIQGAQHFLASIWKDKATLFQLASSLSDISALCWKPGDTTQFLLNRVVSPGCNLAAFYYALPTYQEYLAYTGTQQFMTGVNVLRLGSYATAMGLNALEYSLGDDHILLDNTFFHLVKAAAFTPGQSLGMQVVSFYPLITHPYLLESAMVKTKLIGASTLLKKYVGERVINGIVTKATKKYTIPYVTAKLGLSFTPLSAVFTAVLAYDLYRTGVDIYQANQVAQAEKRLFHALEKGAEESSAESLAILESYKDVSANFHFTYAYYRFLKELEFGKPTTEAITDLAQFTQLSDTDQSAKEQKQRASLLLGKYKISQAIEDKNDQEYSHGLNLLQPYKETLPEIAFLHRYYSSQKDLTFDTVSASTFSDLLSYMQTKEAQALLEPQFQGLTALSFAILSQIPSESNLVVNTLGLYAKANKLQECMRSYFQSRDKKAELHYLLAQSNLQFLDNIPAAQTALREAFMEISNHPEGYTLEQLPAATPLAKGKIYIHQDQDALVYTIVDEAGQTQTGPITAQHMGMSELPATFEDLRERIPFILKVTSEREHTPFLKFFMMQKKLDFLVSRQRMMLLELTVSLLNKVTNFGYSHTQNKTMQSMARLLSHGLSIGSEGILISLQLQQQMLSSTIQFYQKNLSPSEFNTQSFVGYAGQASYHRLYNALIDCVADYAQYPVIQYPSQAIQCLLSLVQLHLCYENLKADKESDLLSTLFSMQMLYCYFALLRTFSRILPFYCMVYSSYYQQLPTQAWITFYESLSYHSHRARVVQFTLNFFAVKQFLLRYPDAPLLLLSLPGVQPMLHKGEDLLSLFLPSLPTFQIPDLTQIDDLISHATPITQFITAAYIIYLGTTIYRSYSTLNASRTLHTLFEKAENLIIDQKYDEALELLQTVNAHTIHTPNAILTFKLLHFSALFYKGKDNALTVYSEISSLLEQYESRPSNPALIARCIELQIRAALQLKNVLSLQVQGAIREEERIHLAKDIIHYAASAYAAATRLHGMNFEQLIAASYHYQIDALQSHVYAFKLAHPAHFDQEIAYAIGAVALLKQSPLPSKIAELLNKIDQDLQHISQDSQLETSQDLPSISPSLGPTLRERAPSRYGTQSFFKTIAYEVKQPDAQVVVSGKTIDDTSLNVGHIRSLV